MAQNSAMIALTDMEWLTILVDKEIYSNVNFWTPTPWNIKNLRIGGTVFFLSKIEYGRKICGFGIFREYKNLNIHLAWEEFGYANGVSSFDELERRVNKYVSLNSHSGFKFDEHEIGCIVLDNIVFFDKEDRYSPNHYGWEIGKQVVKYKYVEPIRYPDIARSVPVEDFQLVKKKPQYKYVPQKKRKNQSAFKNMLIDIYGEQCCITGESVYAVLDAAHIQEYISEESDHPQNGLLLRSDIHRLFDSGFIAIDEEYKVRISKALTSKEYKQLNGVQLIFKGQNRPSLIALKWHKDKVFRGE